MPMTCIDKPMSSDGQAQTFTLRRWSHRKLEAARAAEAQAHAAPPAPLQPAQPVRASETPHPLPPVETLTFESDFRPFMQPHVDASLRRQALRALLHDPRFNVMDGLDVYIDDYTKPSPLAPALAAAMTQARYTLNPPAQLDADGDGQEAIPVEQRSPVSHAMPAARSCVAAADPVPASAIRPDETAGTSESSASGATRLASERSP